MSSHGLILDASVVATWCFKVEASKYGREVQDALLQSAALVPAVFPLEVSNLLITGERRKRLNFSDSERFLALLIQFPIDVEPQETSRILGATMNLARTH